MPATPPGTARTLFQSPDRVNGFLTLRSSFAAFAASYKRSIGRPDARAHLRAISSGEARAPQVGRGAPALQCQASEAERHARMEDPRAINLGVILKRRSRGEAHSPRT